MLNIKSNKVYATKKCNVCIGWFKSKKYFLVSRVAVLLVFLLSETKKLVLNKQDIKLLEELDKGEDNPEWMQKALQKGHKFIKN